MHGLVSKVTGLTISDALKTLFVILAYQDAFSEVVDGVSDADFVIDVEVDVKRSSRDR